MHACSRCYSIVVYVLFARGNSCYKLHETELWHSDWEHPECQSFKSVDRKWLPFSFCAHLLAVLKSTCFTSFRSHLFPSDITTAWYRKQKYRKLQYCITFYFREAKFSRYYSTRQFLALKWVLVCQNRTIRIRVTLKKVNPYPIQKNSQAGYGICMTDCLQ